ncbi:hypothetical protein KKF81_01435 [Candidatus Micrarchaeota archaeon]|nr:hypothetical protein [Candidatus Micrarchaeota archaeon]MBU1165581.1 hypothetical protein [Candidatus Micrarchaeota archaeon]MBU1887392.1 hypothetical protein [Candidatus Micrarchaeota archaeon]
MNDVEKLTKKTVEGGGVLAMLYFDIHANSKEMVQELGAGFVNNIIHKPGVVFAVGEINEPVGGEENKNWSSSIEVKVLTKDMAALVNICLAHSPFTVEVLKPHELILKPHNINDILSTVAAATAEYKRYIVTKLAKPGELAQIEEDLKKRAEMGKKIRERNSGGK